MDNYNFASLLESVRQAGAIRRGEALPSREFRYKLTPTTRGPAIAMSDQLSEQLGLVIQEMLEAPDQSFVDYIFSRMEAKSPGLVNERVLAPHVRHFIVSSKLQTYIDGMIVDVINGGDDHAAAQSPVPVFPPAPPAPAPPASAPPQSAPVPPHKLLIADTPGAYVPAAGLLKGYKLRVWNILNAVYPAGMNPSQVTLELRRLGSDPGPSTACGAMIGLINQGLATREHSCYTLKSAEAAKQAFAASGKPEVKKPTLRISILDAVKTHPQIKRRALRVLLREAGIEMGNRSNLYHYVAEFIKKHKLKENAQGQLSLGTGKPELQLEPAPKPEPDPAPEIPSKEPEVERSLVDAIMRALEHKVFLKAGVIAKRLRRSGRGESPPRIYMELNRLAKAETIRKNKAGQYCR